MIGPFPFERVGSQQVPSIQTEAARPMLTFPTTTAPGATQASGWITGRSSPSEPIKLRASIGPVPLPIARVSPGPPVQLPARLPIDLILAASTLDVRGATRGVRRSMTGHCGIR